MTLPWGLVLSTPGGAQLYLGDGSTAPSAYDSQDDAIEAAIVPTDRLVVLGAAPAVEPPVRVLPDAVTDLGGVLQETPLAWLSSVQRIMLAGVIRARANWDGVVCLTEQETTHWVHVSAGEVVSFQSAATGRLISALGGAEGDCAVQALEDTLSHPERLAVHLQSAALADKADSVTGHLIGAELAAMRRYWLGQEVLVVEDAPLYGAALEAQGAMVTAIAPDRAWQDGLHVVGQKAGLIG
ncbi:2-dehydro-3-deoxygalactonokinase [Roseovarius aestuarii]|nr:2-dehydro-3-deoxygalactonokinase [Roseovarius aestuarii]